MFSGCMQATILTIIVIFVQTTKYVHCQNASSDIDESYVLPLTKDTFDDAVKNNKYLLVKFFTPRCRHCIALAPDYAAAAKELAESGSEIKLASVDGTVEKGFEKQFDIKGYPTLIFFNHGEQVEYTGERGQNDIVRWLKKRTGLAADELTTVDELNKLKESDEVVVIGAFKDTDGDAASAFLQIAKTFDDISFGIITNKDVLEELNVDKDTIILLKKFDEGRNDLTSSINENSIRKFIQANKLPIVTQFNSETAEKIFNSDIKVFVLLFISRIDDDYAKIQEEFKTAARNFRGKVLFVTVDPDELDSERLVEYFDFKESDYPTVRLIETENEINKFKPDSSDITSSVLTDFINEYFDGKLKPDFFTEDIPEDWDKNPVKILVGKNFHEVVNDKTKTVLVAFISPRCGHCHRLIPIYEQLGEKYKDNSNVIVAKIDSTANEVEHIKIERFPTIKLFPKDSDEVIDYFGERTIANFSKFIDSNGKEDGKTRASDEESVEQAEETEERPEDTDQPPEETEIKPEDTDQPLEETEERPEDNDQPPEETEIKPEEIGEEGGESVHRDL